MEDKTQYKTKDMAPETQKETKPEPKKKEPNGATKAFHFAGSGKYAPITIHAETKERAETEWEKQRKPLQ